MKIFTGTVITLLLAGTLVSLLPTDASAWYCRAGNSVGGTGWGRSNNLERAKGLAVGACNSNRRGGGCRLINCVP
jgi:hypothetical protein